MHQDPDVIHTQRAMALLNASLSDAMEGTSPAVQARFTNALLNVAIHQLIAEEGEARAATMLWRLADCISAPNKPSMPIELSQLDG